MITIENVLLEPGIPEARFCCDLHACRGACCTLEGGRGAPLLEEEVTEIEKAFPLVREHLSREHRDVIDREGLFEGLPGDRATTCVDNRACVFSFTEDGIARCSFEHAFLEGRSTWRKPVSCHLFPLRVSRPGMTRLRYEQISECSPARSKGRRENIPLYDFLKEPLMRVFGTSWYEQFRSICDDNHQERAEG